MIRVALALACVLVVGCDDTGQIEPPLPLTPVELHSCGQFSDGHWDQRFLTPGATGAVVRVLDIKRMLDGTVIAGGRFDAMGGVAAHRAG